MVEPANNEVDRPGTSLLGALLALAISGFVLPTTACASGSAPFFEQRLGWDLGSASGSGPGPADGATLTSTGPGARAGSSGRGASGRDDPASSNDASGASTDAASGSPKSAKKKKDAGRKWIKHKVIPREKLPVIAERYGVTKKEVIRWNKKLQKGKGWIYAGQTLSIYARKFPPPRERISYEVKRGDTWAKIAKKHNVLVADLRAWNKKVPRAFRAGTDLVVWTNPIGPPPPPVTVGGGPLPTFEIRGGAIAVGKPNRGRLQNGVQLPKNEMYSVRDEDKAWATTHTAEHLLEAGAAFKRDTGFDQRLVIGAISLKKGGKFRPHSSHQTGRDVDVRLPRKKGAPKVSSDMSDIDWRLSWLYIKALVATGEVQYIFLSRSRQRKLYDAAKKAGATKKELDKMIQYPRKSKTNNGVVRHAGGHDMHIHVRFTCAPSNKRCESY